MRKCLGINNTLKYGALLSLDYCQFLFHDHAVHVRAKIYGMVVTLMRRVSWGVYPLLLLILVENIKTPVWPTGVREASQVKLRNVVMFSRWFWHWIRL